MRRVDLGKHSGGEAWHVMPGSDAWVDLEPHPEDVVALYKESLHSTQLSQMPVLVLPHAVAHGKLSKSDLKPAPIKVLGGPGEDRVQEDSRSHRGSAMGIAPGWCLLEVIG